MFGTTAVSASMAMTADPDDMAAILDSLALMLGLDPNLLELENAGSTGSRRAAQAMVISFKVYATPEQMAQLDAALNDPSLASRMGADLQSRGVSVDVQPVEISSIADAVIREGEVWAPVDGVYMLKDCPRGFLLINTTVETQGIVIPAPYTQTHTHTHSHT